MTFKITPRERRMIIAARKVPRVKELAYKYLGQKGTDIDYIDDLPSGAYDSALKLDRNNSTIKHNQAFLRSTTVSRATKQGIGSFILDNFLLDSAHLKWYNAAKRYAQQERNYVVLYSKEENITIIPMAVSDPASYMVAIDSKPPNRFSEQFLAFLGIWDIHPSEVTKVTIL